MERVSRDRDGTEDRLERVNMGQRGEGSYRAGESKQGMRRVRKAQMWSTQTQKL